jgi:hypothetical protein
VAAERTGQQEGRQSGRSNGRMPHDAHSKEKFISGLKLERVKKILCDAHNSVASRDALTRRRGKMALLRRFGRPSRQPVSFRRDPCRPLQPLRLSTSGQGRSSAGVMPPTHSARVRKKTGRIEPGRSMECLAPSFGNHRPRWAVEHYQDVIFGSNATGTKVAFLPRLLLIRNCAIDNCTCIIFHLASQQASGTIHMPYVMPSRCEAL